MFKDIIQTISARYAVAFMNLLLIFINSKALGREAMGTVGVIYASAFLTVIFNSILCGNTIVYFQDRYGLRCVFYPAYVWAIAGSAAACGLMALLGVLPEGYGTAVFALAALTSIMTANTLMLLGKNRMKAFNATHVLQGSLMFLLLTGLYFVAGRKSIDSYLSGVLAAYGAACLYSFLLLLPYLAKEKATAFWSVLKEMTVYGLWSAADNLAEGLAARLNYFLIRHTGGYSPVGLLDTGTRLAEGVWHISNSVSFIEYNSMSKTADAELRRIITLRLFKLTYCALAAVMAIAVSVPERVLTEWLLTPEFAGVREIIVCLSAGIIAAGANRILSHYFIGVGRIRYSAFSSAVGLLALLVAGSVLIPAYGVKGAALSASIAYAFMLAFSLYIFMKQTGTKIKECIISRKDLRELYMKVRKQ